MKEEHINKQYIKIKDSLGNNHSIFPYHVVRLSTFEEEVETGINYMIFVSLTDGALIMIHQTDEEKDHFDSLFEFEKLFALVKH